MELTELVGKFRPYHKSCLKLGLGYLKLNDLQF